MVTWIVQNTRVILSMILKYYVNALCSNRRNISLYMLSRHAITLKVLEHPRILRNICSRMTRELVRHDYNRERLEYNEKIGNQCHINKEKIGSKYVKRGIV